MRRPVIRPLTVTGTGTPAGALVSALAHALVIVAVIGGTTAGTAVLQHWENLPEGLRFLVPPNVTRPEPTRELAFSTGSGDGGTSVAERESEFGQRRAGSAQHETGTGVDAPPPALDAATEAAMMNAMLSTSYQVLEVDSEAARDPNSAAPVYPPDLEARGIEGHVIVRFVVDSTGLADISTVLTVQATHAAFDRAVREALPRMRFRPAMVGDRAVRQLAEQLFAFEIPARIDTLP
jgi:TonB family protein